MLPVLFSIGPLTIHTYGLFLAAGFLAGILSAIGLGKSSGFDPPKVLDMGIIILVSGLVGSRLMYVLINISYYIRIPLDALKIWEGGLVFSGGLILSVLSMFAYSRRRNIPLRSIGDLWAPAVALGQGIGRLGCFMAGCCYGKPTDLPWGSVFKNPESLAPLYIPLHPTQIYSAISGFVIFLVLIVLSSKKKFEGQVLLWFLILHSTGRLLVERFRGDNRGMILFNDMSLTQFVTTLILVVSVITLIYIKSRTGHTEDPGQ